MLWKINASILRWDLLPSTYTSTASNLQAPPRADVIRSLKNGIVLNLLGMGASVLGMQATVGLLVAKALTSSANPYYQGLSPGYSPVLALDVFLVQVFIISLQFSFWNIRLLMIAYVKPYRYYTKIKSRKLFTFSLL